MMSRSPSLRYDPDCMEKAWYFAARQVINPVIREAARGAGQITQQ
jgi:hypothetical protein